jgi:hypothetical protein
MQKKSSTLRATNGRSSANDMSVVMARPGFMPHVQHAVLPTLSLYHSGSAKAAVFIPTGANGSGTQSPKEFEQKDASRSD